MTLYGVMALLCAQVAPPASQSAVHIWILTREEAHLYSAVTMQPVASLGLPDRAGGRYRWARAGAGGRLLINLSLEPHHGFPLGEVSAGVWVWDGTAQHVAKLQTESGSTQKQVAFSDTGDRLVWVETRNAPGPSVDAGRDGLLESTNTSYHILSTDLDGGDVRFLGGHTFETCGCLTGVCDETCPEPRAWPPSTGVRGSLLVTHVVPGQLGTEHLGAVLYRDVTRPFSATPVGVLMDILDVSQDGVLVLETIGDGGCCGWMNQGNDLVRLHAAGRTITIFDERRTFANNALDVSFHAGNGATSEDGLLVALTILSTETSGTAGRHALRLADPSGSRPVSARAVEEEYVRVTTTVPWLPAVLVVETWPVPHEAFWLAHSTVVGWWSSRQLLVSGDNGLRVVDVTTGAATHLPIEVPSGAHVVLR